MPQQVSITLTLPDGFTEILAQEIVNRLNLSVPQNNPDRYLNIGEAANYCGVSRSTFDGWRKKKSFVIEKTVGGSVYFRISDLDKFMTNN